MKIRLLMGIALVVTACAADLPTEGEVMTRLKQGGEECVKQVVAASHEPAWVQQFADEYGDELMASAPTAATEATDYEFPSVNFRPRPGVELSYHEEHYRAFSFALLYNANVYRSGRLTGEPLDSHENRYFALDSTWELDLYEDRTVDAENHPRWERGGIHCRTPEMEFRRIRQFSVGHAPDADAFTLVMASGEQWAAYGREKNTETDDSWTNPNIDGLAGEVCHNTVCRGLTTIEPENAMPDVAWEPPVPKFFRDYRARVLELATRDVP